MEYIYAALLLHSAGKEINEAALEKVIAAAGVDVDKAKLKSVVDALKDLDIEATIKEASTMQVAAAPAASASATTEAPKEEKKEEKKTEEEAAAGLGSLFG